MSVGQGPITNVSKVDYVDVLNEYYRYKHDYDERYEEQKNAIKESETMTMQQKRAKIMQLKRNRKCVSCGQTGGTHFTNEDGVLRAQCGNRTQPCSLRIEIIKGKFMNLEDLANASLENAEVLKDNIIKTKLDLLFNYTTEEEALRQFETDRAALNQHLTSTADSAKSIWTWFAIRSGAKKWMRWFPNFTKRCRSLRKL